MQGEHGKMNKRRPLVQAVAPVEKVSITAGIWRGGSMWKVTRATPPPLVARFVCVAGGLRGGGAKR